ncbi:cysteine dioxygenase [Alkalicoccobacillus porphyridii]|uniref:Cysteine dioxygenase n=1 Tax=Alkalicoccobacillus porphyridii TaxID=2597270 RepID=A0A554A0U6_9BACI|nr:cysteine dioxygenase family protein [Alkalicoccobacillus porphyridii]TSB47317.1 hypothetical protein FN960_06140 [Alkalicoccobacillus porphyridii]
MTYLERVKLHLQPLASPSPQDMRRALISLNTKLEELLPFLHSTDKKPYYRRLLFQNEEVELLVMNWSQLSCSPHDHGDSQGWIQVISGSTINTIYSCKHGELPEALFSRKEQNGSIFYAPKAGIHRMKANGGHDLVTLHLYSPPIQNMKVYDLKACAACIVSDECGAWWPEEQHQKIKEMKLKKPGAQPLEKPKQKR